MPSLRWGLPLLAVVGVPGSLPSQNPPPTLRTRGSLAFERPHARTLAPNTVDRWRLDLRANQLVAVSVLQQGVDVLVRLKGPQGDARGEFDSPTGATGTEHVVWIVDQPGAWSLEVLPFETRDSGAYRITWRIHRPVSTRDRDSASSADSARALHATAREEYAKGSAEALRSAIRAWTRGLEFARRSGDPLPVGMMLGYLGAVHHGLGNLDSALARFQEALAVHRINDNLEGVATAVGNIGAMWLEVGRRDSALIYLGEALTVARAIGDRPGEAVTLGNLGVTYVGLGRHDSAAVRLTAALALYRELGDTAGAAFVLTTFGNSHADRGLLAAAQAYYDSALVLRRAIGDRAGESVTLKSIGAIYADRGLLDSALTALRRGLVLDREAGARFEEGNALLNLGTIFDDFSHADSALHYLGQALGIAREIGNKDGEGTALLRQGRILLLVGRPLDALETLHRARAIKRATGERLGEGAALAALGEGHTALGAPDSAFHYLRSALAVHEGIEDRASASGTLGNLGQLYLDSGRPDSAFHYFRRARDGHRQVGNVLGESAVLGEIGAAFLRLAHTDSARLFLTEVLPLVRSVGNRAGEGVILSRLAALYHRGVRPANLVVARAYYDSAATARSAVRRRAGSDPARLSFAEQDVALFESWSLAWLARPRGSREGNGALAALAAAERGRGQALLDLLQPASESSAAGKDLGEEGAELASIITRNGAAALSYLSTADTLVIWFVPPSGALQLTRRPIGRDSIAGLVAALRASLGVADPASERVTLRDGLPLERGVVESRRGSRSTTESLTRRLSAILLPPGLERLPAGTDLAIVPHGPLGLLPFAVLPLGPQASLGQRFALRYAPSLASLQAVAARGLAERDPRQAIMARALVVGNPAMPERTGFGDRLALAALPGAEAEGDWVAEQVQVDALSGPEASELAIRRRLPSAPLVHLATHGYVYASDARVRESFIALAPGGGHDGFLTLGEVLDDPALTLSADLVVLSACQTGLGDLKQAEGTVGLQRAFLAKGARNVLVSLWSVSDQATALLMRRFYSHWLGDADRPSKAEALRRAQEEVRATPGFEAPRYWAAFQLVGAG